MRTGREVGWGDHRRNWVREEGKTLILHPGVCLQIVGPSPYPASCAYSGAVHGPAWGSARSPKLAVGGRR